MTDFMATPNQRKNIRKLVTHLYEVLNTAYADEYDHDDMLYCTIGYAYRSGLFKVMSDGLHIEDDSYLAVVDYNQHDDINDVIDMTFGEDYRRNVVYGNGVSHLRRFDAGREQMKAAIAYVEKAYKIKPQNVMYVTTIEKVDETKAKIEARIAGLSSFVDAAATLGNEYHAFVAASVEQAKAEIKTLQKVLSL